MVPILTFLEHERKSATEIANTLGSLDKARGLIGAVAAWDRQHSAMEEGKEVFRYYGVEAIKATNWVGTLRVGSTTIEVLPKICNDASDPGNLEITKGNLLRMLLETPDIPLDIRDMVGLKFQKCSVLDALAGIYAKRLNDKIRRGLPREYVGRDDNLNKLKGKLLLKEQIKANFIHKERFYCHFDEFVSDTILNRTLKKAAEILHRVVSTPQIKTTLREALMMMGEVNAGKLTVPDLSKVSFSRASETMKPLFIFAKNVIMNRSTSPGSGRCESFAFFFPMEKLFEQYIASIVMKERARIFAQSPSPAVHIQCGGSRMHMLKRDDGELQFLLKPDVLVEVSDEKKILDTKWKMLNTEDSKLGISQADVYQMFAYCKYFNATQTTLIYPRLEGMKDIDFTFVAGDGRKLLVRTIDIGVDLSKREQKELFVSDLKNAFLSKEDQECANGLEE